MTGYYVIIFFVLLFFLQYYSLLLVDDYSFFTGSDTGPAGGRKRASKEVPVEVDSTLGRFDTDYVLRFKHRDEPYRVVVAHIHTCRYFDREGYMDSEQVELDVLELIEKFRAEDYRTLNMGPLNDLDGRPVAAKKGE